MTKLLLFGMFTIALAGGFHRETKAQELEKLLGVRVGAHGITFQVTSGGCTKKSDFSIQQLESFPVQLRLSRNQPDHCEAYVPYGTKIFYSWRELGMGNGSQFVVSNPLGPVTVVTPAAPK